MPMAVSWLVQHGSEPELSAINLPYNTQQRDAKDPWEESKIWDGQSKMLLCRTAFPSLRHSNFASIRCVFCNFSKVNAIYPYRIRVKGKTIFWERHALFLFRRSPASGPWVCTCFLLRFLSLLVSFISFIPIVLFFIFTFPITPLLAQYLRLNLLLFGTKFLMNSRMVVKIPGFHLPHAHSTHSLAVATKRYPAIANSSLGGGAQLSLM